VVVNSKSILSSVRAIPYRFLVRYRGFEHLHQKDKQEMRPERQLIIPIIF